MEPSDLPASMQTGPDGRRWLEHFYDLYPRIEEAFDTVLDESLRPRGPDLLYDLVRDFELPAGSLAVDVGCGEGRHSFELAEQFGLSVLGLDPVPRHIEIASTPGSDDRVRFMLGSAESLPVEDGTADLIWCRDVLVHVGDLDATYAEFRRVLRPDGRVLVYQMFGTDRLEPREAGWLWRTMGVVPASASPSHTEAAISAAGLRVDTCPTSAASGARARRRGRGAPAAACSTQRASCAIPSGTSRSSGHRPTRSCSVTASGTCMP